MKYNKETGEITVNLSHLAPHNLEKAVQALELWESEKHIAFFIFMSKNVRVYREMAYDYYFASSMLPKDAEYIKIIMDGGLKRFKIGEDWML
jgi:hypothetical protein